MRDNVFAMQRLGEYGKLSCWDWEELGVVSSTSHPSLPNNQIDLVDGFAIPICSWDLD